MAASYNDILKATMENVLRSREVEASRKASANANVSGTRRNSKKSSNANELDDIAPVGDRVTSRMTVRHDDEEERTWFQKGVFEDGYDFGDISKAILGSVTDVGENLAIGIAGMGEKAIDAMAWLAPAANVANQAQNSLMYDFDIKEYRKQQKDSAEFIQKDLYDEEQVAKAIISAPVKKVTGIDAERDSVLGEKSDALVQSGGQLLATAGLAAAGLPWWATTGVTSFGSEAESALKEGASFEEAGLSAAVSAGSELLTEKISGGISFGGKTMDDALTKQIARGISNKTARTLAKLGVDMAGEGAEEVLSGAMSAVGQKLTYADEKELSELFSSEEAWESFIGGAVLGGIGSGHKAVKSHRKGVDFVSELTDSEQKVVDKVYKDRVAEEEKNGKVSQSKKTEIYDRVLRDMEKGYISIDEIESALGGETYDKYKKVSEQEESMQNEFDTLNKMKQLDMTGEQIDRREHLRNEIRKAKETSERSQLKSQLSEEVLGLVKGSRLGESYNERARRGQTFEADLSQYDKSQQEVIKRAVDSGILNNTNRTHEFVDIIAKISADKGVLFDFTNNQKLKESGFAVEGKQVNGFVTKDGITLNIDSPKAWQSTVGHEITHVLEGTEVYDALKQTIADYAKARGEYQGRYDSLAELYKDVKDADIEGELTADLVGDYLFSDTDFISNLSVKNRNVFQKIYDEIKYLCKVATAGSKEARELERVRKAFEDAYRAGGKAQGETKYSISAETDTNYLDAVNRGDTDTAQKMVDEAAKKSGYTVRVLHGTQKFGFTVTDTSLSDDKLSFFATSDVDTAKTYSSLGGKRGISEDADYDSIDEESVAHEENARDQAYWLAEKISEFAGFYGYVETELIDDRFKEIANDYESGRISQEEADRQMYEFADELIANAYNEDAYDGQEFYEWQESEEAEQLYNTVSGTISAYFALVDFNRFADSSGNYDFYANTDGLLVIDGNGAKWNDIKSDILPDITSEEYKKYGYRGHWDKWTTRSISKYASDNGYKGVLFKNIYDDGGRSSSGLRKPADVYSFFYPQEQVKSADPVTYDDSGNVNPLSKRFNAESKDIRYSLSDSDGRQLTKEQQEYFRDSNVGNEHGLDAESEVQFSLSNDTAYMDKAISMNESMHRIDSNVLAETKALRERIAERMNAIKGRGLVGLPEDIEGNTYIANSSYDGTEENTTICPRSLASEAFVDAVSEYLGRPLTVEEQIYISQDLQGRSLTPECTYCYVATDRKAYRAFLGEYVSQRDAVIQKVKENPGADVSRSGDLYKEFLNGRKDTNPMYSRFKMWVDAYKNGKPMIDASHLANINKLMGDINSEFGAELKPQIVDAMKYAQSASWAKKRVNYVAYNGHILKWKQDRINKLNSHYGLRMYSFSDFHPAFVLENMQMITDASVRGLKMLGYTKDTDFVEIFAPSGMNINVSTFGFESGGNIYENNLIGAEWEKAKELRSQYPNVGITFVATNDNLVNWALDQDWIDVVIPYHLVRTGTEVAKAFGYTNYTSESSDTKKKNWTKGNQKYIAPTEHNNDKEIYLAALEKNNLSPRFERFLGNPNYMKLVNECRQPASQSKPVQPVFNENAAMVALAKLEANGYYQPIGGSVDRMYEIAAEVAENMTQQIAPTMSLSEETEQIAPIGRYATPATELRYEAPVAGTKAGDLFQEDIAPVMGKTASGTPQVPIFESREKGAIRGQTTMFEETEPQSPARRITRQQLHNSIIDRIKTTFQNSGIDFDKVLKGAKNLSTFATVDNTPQRVMEKALGYKEGGILADLTVNKVAQNESAGIKWLNSFTDRKSGTLAQISRQYHIKPGSKESAAAQMYAEGFYVNENKEIVSYGDPELIQDFPDANVRRNIKGLAADPRIRKIYDDTLASINESRKRNGYPEIPRLDNYFLHFRAMEDTFSTLGLPFNPNDIKAKDLPTDLNGVTADLKPGQPYFASAMHRTGKRTSFDLLGGLERYLSSAKNQIYHIDDIQTLRALRNYIADTYGQANGLEGLDALTEEEAQERIEQVYDSHLSTFAKFLNEEANVLAGKTALIDRGIEGVIGRRGITFLDTLNKQVGSNMVGYNISSSLTNFLPVVQTFAKSNKAAFVKAFAQTVANKVSRGKLDSFAEDSPVVIRRKGADRFYRTPWQKIADPGYALMGVVDDISTELIARTKYNEFVRKGMDPQKAHFETDKWVSKLMGDRSLGQQPQLYNSKMLGLITKFQLEVRNQLDSQFYDTIQEKKASNEHIQNGLARNAKTAAQVASTLAQLAVVQHLFGNAFETVAGYNPAFDIIEVLMTAFGYDDEEDSEDTGLDNFAQALLALAEDLPYASTFTGGRVPISEAIPDVNAILRGEDEYGNEIGVPKALIENAKEIAPYYLLPGGYGQIKKTAQGMSMFSEDHPIAGSYTDSGNLRFPVEDTLGNRIHAGIFGQYANENARKYFDEEQRTLNPEQTEIFAGLDIPIEDYWEYRDNLYDFYDVKDRLKEAADADGATAEDILKSRYINTLSGDIYALYEQQKQIASGNSRNKKSELRKLQSQMEQLLADSNAMDDIFVSGAYAEIGDRRYNYDADADTWYEIKAKNADGGDNWFYLKEQEVTKGLGITPEAYWNNREEYNYAYDEPGKYALSQAVGGYKAYRNYSSELWNIKADKDKNGKSINGTRKAKVFDYINSLDADYGEKIILFKSEYPADDTYNYEIIEYLNGRNDISYKEMETILKELGFKVDANGYIKW